MDLINTFEGDGQYRRQYIRCLKRPADIIPTQGDKYRRHTNCHKRKCKHFQWVDDCLTTAEKISVRTLEAQNRSLQDDVLIAIATIRRYMDAEMGMKLLLQDAIRGQLMSMCISIRTLEAQNRSLWADVTATATMYRHMDAKMGVKLLLQDAIRGQLMSICVCVTAFIVYVMIFTGVLI
ncbi:hypothetical protein Cgig2_022432 [Carnegiea gigantea]|uniref:Uncharacterized protein n=1 Tax=Carnegiea gigantea TaxID=171969 RepID=A0A9Q1GW10_9CARY|nr:hypothetical protein Cgig2_022432 [Carnegiea gigantea]